LKEERRAEKASDELKRCKDYTEKCGTTIV
jgi:hypothetical protein